MEQLQNPFDVVSCPKYSPTFKGDKPGKTDCLYRVDDNGNCAFCGGDENYRCVKEVMFAPIPLSSSTIGDFVKCPFLFYLRNVRGVRIKPSHTSKAIKMGKLFDVALQNILSPGSEDPNKVIEEYEIEDFEIGKVRALVRAYKALGIQVETGFELQAKFDKEVDIPGIAVDGVNKLRVKGFYDRKYPKYFVENKLSSRPDNYLDPFFIQSQVGTYFLADDSLEYCVMEVVRTPDLKSTNKFRGESAEEHEERTFTDIISRPLFYFIGLDRDTMTFGKKFYRREFDLEEIKYRYRAVNILIHDMQVYNSWYKNDSVCGSILPGIACDMKPLCRYNVMSEEMYTISKKQIGFK